MMNDGTCKIPCYEEDEDCNLTVVKIFLAKNLDSKMNHQFYINLIQLCGMVCIKI